MPKSRADSNACIIKMELKPTLKNARRLEEQGRISHMTNFEIFMMCRYVVQGGCSLGIR